MSHPPVAEISAVFAARLRADGFPSAQ